MSERSAAVRPPTALRSLVAVASAVATWYCRATPRLLPQVPPPAVADGWLVLKNVVPLIEIALPTTFSPAPRVMNQPRSVPSLADTAACVSPPAQEAAFWMQFEVRSDKPAIGPVGVQASAKSAIVPSVMVGSQVVAVVPEVLVIAPVTAPASPPLSLNM